MPTPSPTGYTAHSISGWESVGTTTTSSATTFSTEGTYASPEWMYIVVDAPKAPPIVPTEFKIQCGNVWDMRDNARYELETSVKIPKGADITKFLKEFLKPDHDIWKTWNYINVNKFMPGQTMQGCIAKCTFCGKPSMLGLLSTEHRRLYLACPKCAEKLKKCYICGMMFNNYSTSVLRDSENHYLCPKCNETNSWRLCKSCGRLTDEPEGVLCLTCRPRKPQRSPTLERSDYRYMDEVHDYAHKPSPIFHPSSTSKIAELYFGVELEVDKFPSSDHITNAGGEINRLTENENLFYLKRDGSIHAGFEVVTHPCTLDFHRTAFPWNEIRKVCLKHKGRSHETDSCGLHVHFNVNFMGTTGSERDLNTLKLLHFVERFWTQLVRFSRRRPEELQAYARRYYDDFTPVPANIGKVGDAKAMRARGMTVNLQNMDTIEIRLFKGSLNPITILGTLEFLHYTLNLLKSSDAAKIQQLSWRSFVEGVDKGMYPNLTEYLVRRRLDVTHCK